jgi:lipopolysaccharide transport system ATP-binding protein
MTVIELENIGKQYRLGYVGSGTLRGDMQRWWARMRGHEDPTLTIGMENKLDTIEGEYVWALRDINLKVEQGEVLGIIGKNGAGKSTMLKLLSRVTSPTTGVIKVRGRIASLLEVGTGFHGELTGRENIFINGAILGMTKQEIRSKFDEIVDFAGVAKYIDTPVKRYSSGMYVRLAFAVAAHLEPEILIVDEVLAVGDAEFQKKAIGKMQDISAGQGRTVLFVSHNMASVQKLCNRGVLMEKGMIRFEGDIVETTDLYLSKNRLFEIRHQEVNDYILNEQVTIKKMSFSKAFINPFEEFNIELEINSTIENIYDGLAVLIYDSNDNRIAVIDLRDERFLNISIKRFKIETHIELQGLISKEYYVGLAVGSKLFTANVFNLFKITVLEHDNQSSFRHYPLSVMGQTFIKAHNNKIKTYEN